MNIVLNRIFIFLKLCCSPNWGFTAGFVVLLLLILLLLLLTEATTTITLDI